MPGQIEHIIPSPDSRTAHVAVNGKLYAYSDRDGLRKSGLALEEDSTRAARKIELVRFGERDALLALSRKHALHVDGKQVANNVTSFCVHSEFVLVTTLQHALICFGLDEAGLEQLCTGDLSAQPWENEAGEVRKSQGEFGELDGIEGLDGFNGFGANTNHKTLNPLKWFIFENRNVDKNLILFVLLVY